MAEDLLLEWVTSGVMGLCLGSFLNVVIYRLPIIFRQKKQGLGEGEAGKKITLSAPPSSCPGCGNRILARDNIPVLSWVLLRGKCRHCHRSISCRYPLVELLTGVSFVAVTWLMGLGFWTVIAWLAICSLIVTIFIRYDLRRKNDIESIDA